MGAARRLGPAGVTLQLALALSGARLWGNAAGAQPRPPPIAGSAAPRCGSRQFVAPNSTGGVATCCAPPPARQRRRGPRAHEGRTIVVRHGDAHVQAISSLCDAIQPGGAAMHSESEETRPAHAEAIVVVDGWGHTAWLLTAERCQRHFGSPARLAILNGSSCTVAEVLDSGFDNCASRSP